MVEEGLQGSHRERVRVRSGVESHDREIERSQVLEDVVGVEGVDLGGSDEVSHDDLVVAGVGGLLPVVQGQHVNLGQMGLHEGQSKREHRVNFWQMQLPREPSDYWRSSGQKGFEGQPNLQSYRQGV